MLMSSITRLYPRAKPWGFTLVDVVLLAPQGINQIFDPEVERKMGNRAERTMKTINKLSSRSSQSPW